MLFVFKRALTLWAVDGTRPREWPWRLTEPCEIRRAYRPPFCGASQPCATVQPACIFVGRISAVYAEGHLLTK